MDMIRIIYDHQELSVAAIVEVAQGTTAINESIYGVLQGDPTVVVYQAMALGIDIIPVMEFINQNNIQLDISMTSSLQKVIKDRVFGQRLLNEFLSENKELDLTVEQDVQMLEGFSIMRGLLDIGAIKQARLLWLNVPTDEIITQERKQKYIDMIDEYISD